MMISATTAIDPVCGIEVETGTALLTASRRGKVYYFCSIGCQQAFLREPEQFLAVEHRHSMMGAMLSRVRGLFIARWA